MTEQELTKNIDMDNKDYSTTGSKKDLKKESKQTAKTDPIPDGTKKEVYMGIDIGSVSLKIVLIDKEDNIIEKLWLRNQGSPIDSSKKGLVELKEKLTQSGMYDKIKIIGVGTTGSARYLIKSVVGGDIAKTEIIAHAVASSTYFPKVNTILEIGGQDSKIIILRNGIVADFAMNSVCAAGTGSFLDHQATRLGIPIEEFGAYAMRSTASVTIAGRCGVFAESDMIHKAQMGYAKEDIIQGLCDALVRNYLNNVGKGKDILSPIVFQGGVSFNKGLVKSFEIALGTKIEVPENNILMGAIGAAILIKEEALRTIKMTGSWSTKFRGFQVTDIDFETKAFNCQGCPNRCEVVTVYMKNSGKGKNKEVVARWGDRCGKWEVY
jgi:predicted CoA-substrate-specific enzyme activase